MEEVLTWNPDTTPGFRAALVRDLKHILASRGWHALRDNAQHSACWPAEFTDCEGPSLQPQLHPRLQGERSKEVKGTHLPGKLTVHSQSNAF